MNQYFPSDRCTAEPPRRLPSGCSVRAPGHYHVDRVSALQDAEARCVQHLPQWVPRAAAGWREQSNSLQTTAPPANITKGASPSILLGSPPTTRLKSDPRQAQQNCPVKPSKLRFMRKVTVLSQLRFGVDNTIDN